MHSHRPVQCLGAALAVLLAMTAPRGAAATAECGEASWYEFTSKTASGETADPEALTAAHPTLPFGARVVVENLSNGRTVEVRINDRGPHTGGRIIDVTRAAAEKLGLVGPGVGRVRVVPRAKAGKASGCP